MEWIEKCCIQRSAKGLQKKLMEVSNVAYRCLLHCRCTHLGISLLVKRNKLLFQNLHRTPCQNLPPIYRKITDENFKQFLDMKQYSSSTYSGKTSLHKQDLKLKLISILYHNNKMHFYNINQLSI